MQYEDFFSGKRLYGDDLTDDQIAQWYRLEEKGYYELAEKGGSAEHTYTYGYHALNFEHAFRYLKNRSFNFALAIGCARGDDIAPISCNISKIIAIEPAEAWWGSNIGEAPAEYRKPNISCKIDCDAGKIDLSLCLGALHHIPNATAMIREFGRVSALGGLLIIREPICTMGDWRKPRPGLTMNERGFPIRWLEEQFNQAGFRIIQRTMCMFPATVRLANLLGIEHPYNSRFIVRLDAVISRMTAFNYHYHRDALYKKLCPSSAFYILERVD